MYIRVGRLNAVSDSYNNFCSVGCMVYPKSRLHNYIFGVHSLMAVECQEKILLAGFESSYTTLIAVYLSHCLHCVHAFRVIGGMGDLCA